MQLKELVDNYLADLYPLTRINQKGKFKRGIYIDGKSFIFSNKNDVFQVKLELTSILSKLFGIGDKMCEKIINDYIPSK